MLVFKAHLKAYLWSTLFLIKLKQTIIRHINTEIEKAGKILHQRNMSPCLMCVQYIGSSIHRGNTMSTSGSVQYIGRCHEYIGDVQYIGGNHDVSGGIS